MADRSRVVTTSPSVEKTTLVAGARWIASSQISVQAGRLLVAVILARILVPEDFGVVSLVMIVVSFIDVAIGDVGTAAAIVQRQDITDREISTMFWFNLGVGIASTVIAVLAAPVMRHVVDHPDIVIAFRIVALTFIVAGFRMAHHAVLRKNLQYRTLALLDGVSFLVYFATAVGLAVAGAGFWSLIVAAMASNVMLTIGVWFTSGFRPEFTFRWAHLRSVAAFSLNLSAFRFLNFFIQQGDRFLVGAYISVEALGFYSQANRLVRYPLDTATVVYRRVLVPAMTRDQDNNERLAEAFIRSIGVIAVAVVPFTLLAAVLAEPIVLALPGEKWLPAVPLIRLLAVVGLLQTVSGQSGIIFQIKDRTDLLLYWGIASGAVTITAYVIGLHWGVEGVAWGYVIAMAILTPPSFLLPMRLINTPVRRLWPLLRGVVLAAVSLVGASLLVLRLLESPDTNSWITLLASSAAGGIAYLLVLVFTNNRSFLDLAEVGSPALAKRIARIGPSRR